MRRETVRFATFFLLNFGLNRRFRPIRTDTARVGASRETKKKKNWTRDRRAGSGVGRTSPRRAASVHSHLYLYLRNVWAQNGFKLRKLLGILWTLDDIQQNFIVC